LFPEDRRSVCAMGRHWSFEFYMIQQIQQIQCRSRLQGLTVACQAFADQQIKMHSRLLLTTSLAVDGRIDTHV
jgi:hypothetical protein